MKNLILYFKELLRPIRLLSIIRHYKLSHLHKGKGCLFGMATSITNSEIGTNVFVSGGQIISSKIGRRTYFNSNIYALNCVIGNYCSIGPDVTIGFSPHPIDFVSTHPAFYSNNKSFKTFADKMYFDEAVKLTTIGNDVWIGGKATILPGVTISDGAIIAYGSLVTKDVPPYAIVGGVPAKTIKYRFSENIINDLLRIKWWEMNDEFIQVHYKLFLDPQAFIGFFKNNKKF